MSRGTESIRQIPVSGLIWTTASESARTSISIGWPGRASTPIISTVSDPVGTIVVSGVSTSWRSRSTWSCAGPVSMTTLALPSRASPLISGGGVLRSSSEASCDAAYHAPADSTVTSSKSTVIDATTILRRYHEVH